jgi:hypothetical protein
MTAVMCPHCGKLPCWRFAAGATHPRKRLWQTTAVPVQYIPYLMNSDRSRTFAVAAATKLHPRTAAGSRCKLASTQQAWLNHTNRLTTHACTCRALLTACMIGLSPDSNGRRTQSDSTALNTFSPRCVAQMYLLYGHSTGPQQPRRGVLAACQPLVTCNVYQQQMVTEQSSGNNLVDSASCEC